jgi:coenzyme F420-0:L-glutamate ligase / coenzyme F420-1:gamma-L-glutamate ligase
MSNYHELLALMRARRSIRRFSREAVSRKDLLRLIEAARWAPSNHNRQPWKFIVIEDATQIQTIAREVGEAIAFRLKSLPAIASPFAGDLVRHGTLFACAPVLLIILHKQPVGLSAALLDGLSNPALVSGEPLSVAMAVQNLLLTAQALGLGTCVLTAPLLAPNALAGKLVLPAGYDITCLVALGHPDEAPDAPRRKGLEHIVEFGNPCRQTHETPSATL